MKQISEELLSSICYVFWNIKSNTRQKGALLGGRNLVMRIPSSFNLLLLKDTGVIPFPS
jgi:hypothetical protein